MIPRAAFAGDSWKKRREFSEWEAEVDLIQRARYGDGEFIMEYNGENITLSRGELVTTSAALMKAWGWHSTKSPFEAWLDLIQRARYGQGEYVVNTGKHSPDVTIERGQLVGALRKLADEWDWNKGKVERFLNRLVKENMITIDNQNGVNVITLVNYEQYNPAIKNDVENTPKICKKTGTGSGTGSVTPTGTGSGTGSVNTSCESAGTCSDSEVKIGTGSGTGSVTPTGTGSGTIRIKSKEERYKKEEVGTASCPDSASPDDDPPPNSVFVFSPETLERIPAELREIDQFASDFS